MACSSVSTAASSEEVKKEQRLIDVMFLCDEWKSSKGGLSTFNREFAMNLAETTTGSMKIHCYVSQSDDRDREDAKQHGVNLITAEAVPGSRDYLDWLKVPPPELQHPHVVIGHGRKLGTPAYHIQRATSCKWIQFVHVFCEDLGKYKNTTTAATDTIEENEEKHKMEIELCRAADAVVAVGSRLQEKYSRSLLNVKVEIITPGIFGNFSNESKLAVDRSVVKKFNLFMFGRATLEDLSLKGYDIVANAIGSLGKNFQLTFVGSSPGEHRKVEQWFLDNTCINRNQLTIRGYCSKQEELKMMFCQSDLVALPSRTEGFGLVSVEAISAGVPILVSDESGIAEALQKVKGGKAVIVGSDEDADEWARRIRAISEESAEVREANALKFRENYRKAFSWRTECEKFKGMLERLMQKAPDDEVNIITEVEDLKPTESINQSTTSISEPVACQRADDQRASAKSTSMGGASHTGKEDIQALKERAFSLIVVNYLETTPPQCSDERNKFMEYLEKMQLIMKGFRSGSLVITVKCESLQILDELWKDYSSGHLGEVIQNCLVTEKILKELNLVEMKLKTTLDKEEYNTCKVYFERVGCRDALSAQSYFINTEDEAQLERWKQNTEVVESEKGKSTSPILEMSSIGDEKEGEELQETIKGIFPLPPSVSSDTNDKPEGISMKLQGTEDGVNWGRVAAVTGGAVVTGAAAVVAAPGVLGAAGFTAGGVAAGSIAAAAQSAIYGGFTGGVFSLLQSAGAAGIGLAGNAAIGAAGASVGGALSDLGARLYGSRVKTIKLLICGGGSDAHAFAGIASSQKETEVRVLTLYQDEAERWSSAMQTQDLEIKVHHKGQEPTFIKSKSVSITKNPDEALRDIDFVVFVLPAFAHEDYLIALKPYINPGMTLIGFPGGPGFEFQVHYALDEAAQQCTILNFESSPWICRTTEFGVKCEVLGTKKILFGAIKRGSEKPKKDPVSNLQYLLGPLPVLDVSGHMLGVQLMSVNAYLHTSIMYGQWKDWDGDTLDEPPLFYCGLTEVAATFLSSVSEEIVKIKEAVEIKTREEMSKVVHIHMWHLRRYGDDIVDRSTLKTAIQTNAAYQTIQHPVKKDRDGKLRPDFTCRYLTEDVPYGLVVIRGIAEIVGLHTPNIDNLLRWCQQKMGKEYLVNSKVQGKDVASSGAPQRYGLTTLESIM
ncbi:uncharacterized protein LOC111338068 isoform X3 [Stylophora pistillata]|uniref:uncharacterized protein LOC111338068 isoform X3 n=1 Tax=Stylophora pistillata TaxID=50429 RepID=UPI000C0536D6|nr:uncharacterized protein LOC111338068 isoform X3 [Stylophora pistillata]